MVENSVTENLKPIQEEKATEQADDISPVEYAKKILEESKKLVGEMIEQRKKIEKIQADFLISGRSFAGKERVTPEQEAKAKAQAQADEIVKAFK